MLLTHERCFMFFLLLEFCIGALLAVFVVTNVLLPSINGTRLFPWFRRRQLDAALTAANEDISVAETERRIALARAQADAIRKQNAQPTGESVNE